MHTKIGYKVEVSERLDPRQGWLRILPRGVAEWISNSSKSQTRVVRDSSTEPTTRYRAQSLATIEFERPSRNTVETAILPETWLILTKREKRQWARAMKK